MDRINRIGMARASRLLLRKGRRLFADALFGSKATGYNDDVEIQETDAVNMKHAAITSAILRSAFGVVGELGAGFLESVYERALERAFREDGLFVERQTPIEVRFRGHSVGEFYADLLVEHVVIVELKAVQALLPEHKAQVINYLRATDIEVGLLINFGRPRLEYHRLTRTIDRDQSAPRNL
jgi:GxxExxY protein